MLAVVAADVIDMVVTAMVETLANHEAPNMQVTGSNKSKLGLPAFFFHTPHAPAGEVIKNAHFQNCSLENLLAKNLLIILTYP